MALQIVFSKRADKKLDKILDYLKSEWPIKVTEEFLEVLYNTLDNIASFPDIGLTVDELKSIKAFLVTKHNRVYYRIEKDKLIVLNFIDTRKKS